MADQFGDDWLDKIFEFHLVKTKSIFPGEKKKKKYNGTHWGFCLLYVVSPIRRQWIRFRYVIFRAENKVVIEQRWKKKNQSIDENESKKEKRADIFKYGGGIASKQRKKQIQISHSFLF